MPASNLLTDKEIGAALRAAAAANKPRKINDGDGLVLETRPTGVGWWRLRYSRDGREGMLSLGTYPEVSLRDARRRRDAEKKVLAAGGDPSAVRKLAKADRIAQADAARRAAAGEPALGSFEHVARDWLTSIHEKKVSAGHAERTKIRFEQDAFPWIGARPIDSIEPPELQVRRGRGRSR